VLLAEALSREDMSCSLHWLWRGEGSLRATRSEVQAWTKQLATELERDRPDAILLHYSVFAYSYRGLPLFVHPTLSVLRGARAPVIAVLHELAYPWRRGGWRGTAWALTQRALLFDVMRTSTAAIVTADFRSEWLGSRRWLPRRPLRVAPVFSNLPPPLPSPAALPRPDCTGRTIGLFGYSYEGAAVSLVLGALARLADRGIEARLMLLGAPGPTSQSGEAWLAAARAQGVAHALSFSGALPAQELSDALAACDVLLFADASGPSSRKGTLAASLASGSPVVAVDGVRRWPELIQSEAVQIAAPASHALADAIGALLADEGLRKALGTRGEAFARERMGVARTAEVVMDLLAGMPS
jgi:glycosyltransferase involved in cell wall biosynthesis